MRLKFVHTADLHLDSPFTGLKSTAPDNVARLLYEATFDAYTNIIDLCITERVDALLVAGDIYDGADRSFRAQHRFIAGLQQLDDAGIRSFVCHGNHDPLDGWEARLDYPPTCYRFGEEFESAPVFQDDPDRAVVYGISYSHPRRLRQPRPSSRSLSAPVLTGSAFSTRTSATTPTTAHTRHALSTTSPSPASTTGRSATYTLARC